MTNAMPQGQTRNRSEDKVQGVVRTLQHDIIFGRLKPRERLVEEELGARFDVGRHVVRAAIEELDRLGLVRRLFGACGNRYLQQTIQEYWLKTASIHCYAIGKPDLARQSRDEHIGMIEALEVGDRERLVQLCIDHMLPALEAFKAAHGGWAVRTTSSR